MTELEHLIHDEVTSKLNESDLYDMVGFLYPSVTLQEFEETLELEGFEDTKTRLEINLRDRLEMIDKYGGDGKSRLRELYKQFKEGTLGKKNILTSGQQQVLNEFLNKRGGNND